MINKLPLKRVFMGLFLLLPIAAQSQDFSVVVLPDSQFYSENFPEVIEAQIDWIVANEVAENIIYVAQLGDLKDDATCDNRTVNVGTGGGRSEWQILDDAYTDLDTAGIPYGVVPGNHDFDQVGGGCPNWTTQRPLGDYNTNFGPLRFNAQPWYGDPGVPTDGNRVPNSNEDNFTLFGFGGVNFIAINLAYKQGANAMGMDPEVTWANNLLATYSDRLGIVTSHYLVEENPGNTFGPYGQEIYDGLSGNPNFFMMLSAHERGEAWREDATGRDPMQPVQALLADYQDYLYPPAGPINYASLSTGPPSTGGDSGFMRIMRFNTTTGMVNVETFAPPVPFLGRATTLVSDYFPGSGAGMDSNSASNISFSYQGYVTTVTPTFDIFECDGISGGTCTTPIGTITFPGDSGTQTSGAGFSLTYANGGTYDENDIQNVDWVIDAGTGELTTFSMVADTDPGCLGGTTPPPCSQTTQRWDILSPGLMETAPSGGSCSVTPTGPVCISGIAIGPANLFVPQ